jgi:hypothetical protein
MHDGLADIGRSSPAGRASPPDGRLESPPLAGLLIEDAAAFRRTRDASQAESVGLVAGGQGEEDICLRRRSYSVRRTVIGAQSGPLP